MIFISSSLILMVVVQALARTEWIDPHSLDGSVGTYQSECNCKDSTAPRDVTMSHHQRTLNLLLKALNYNPETSSYRGQITIDLQVEEFNFIKGFSDRINLDTNDWNELDRILTAVYTKSVMDEYMDMLVSWKERLIYGFKSREMLFLMGGLAGMFFIYNLLNARIKVGIVLRYLFLFAFIVDFIFTWIRLLQEKELERMANNIKFKSVPVECDPNKMGMVKYMLFKLGSESDKCKEYHKAMFADDLWSVNPFKVFGTQMGDLIQTPANAFGSAFGQFTSAILANLSWYWLPVLPILLIFILVIICILLSFITKTSFGFNFFHLIQFNFGKGEQRANAEDVISSGHLKTILQCINRSTIEDVPPAIEDKKVKPKSIKEQKKIPTIKITDVGTKEPSEKGKSKKGKSAKLTKSLETDGVKKGGEEKTDENTNIVCAGPGGDFFSAKDVLIEESEKMSF